MKSFICTLTLGLGTLTAFAAVPEGYYNSLAGKSGDALADAVEALSASHTRVTYGDKTWKAFEKTDVRTVNGRTIWWDMYSNNFVFPPEHSAMNIEHSVANSWWGGKSKNADAYADLFHLNPSDGNANNSKKNSPPGIVETATYLDNGVLRIGAPAAGYGGGATSVFEPADEYKGDFARAYFYVFTTYKDIDWLSEYAYIYGSDKKILPWAADMLLKWNREDPVDAKEINRNEEIYALQNNRNPFIDSPELAEYIWGDLKTTAYKLPASYSEPVERPAAPVFVNAHVDGVNTYSAYWWDGFTQEITHSGEKLMVSLDGRDYYEHDASLTIDPADGDYDSHVWRAYCTATVNGQELRSPVAMLTLTARGTDRKDYTLARWEKVTDISQIPLGTRCVILSSNTLRPMSLDGGVSGKAYLPATYYADFTDNLITWLPQDVAIVDFEPMGNGKYEMIVKDRYAWYKGRWHSTGKNTMELGSGQATQGTISFTDAGNFKFTFDENGSLQFNSSAQRFNNYTSSQTPVVLYRFKDFDNTTGADMPVADPEKNWHFTVTGNEITVYGEALIFDINGRRVSGSGLQPGIYIIAGKGLSQKVIIR